MKTKNEDIIKKLFESKCSLSPEERAALNNYEYVNDTFHRQWEEMSEEAVDLVREEKILNGIILKSATTRLYDTEAKIICIVSKKGAQCIECHHKDI